MCHYWAKDQFPIPQYNLVSKTEWRLVSRWRKRSIVLRRLSEFLILIRSVMFGATFNLVTVAYPVWHTPGVQTEDGVLANWRMAPLGGGVEWGRGARCSKWLFLFQITLEVRLLKIALTLNWLVLNVRASSTRKFEMLSEKWGVHYSVNFMNNFGLLVWVPINIYYWVILGIIVKKCI